MRVAAQVLLAYGIILVVGCLWRFMPFDRAAPNLVALSALYLGLTARHRLAPSTLGAVVLGYLADLLMGTPRGLMALTAGILCIFGHVIHRRLIVRGFGVTLAVTFSTGLAAGILTLLLRAYGGLVPRSAGIEPAMLFYNAALTALAGPVVFRLCRTLDARFARTYRERDATLEGLAP
jgi:rod shape-determining protein MreD